MKNGMSRLKNDVRFIVALLGIVLLAGLALLLFRSVGDTATVLLDGEVFAEYSLSENREIEIWNGDGYNVLVIEGGKAFVKSASCPDGICVAHRPIEHNGESIVCLPNKMVVEIHTNSGDPPDIIV